MKPKVWIKEIIKIREEINTVQNKKSIKMINETNSWLFKKINKIDKLLARLVRERTRAQVNHIRNSKAITTDITVIQRIIRNCCEKKLFW